MRERAVLRGDRDPVVGLGDQRGLAGEAVAHDGQRVRRAHQEGVEAVELVEAQRERLLEGIALAHPPFEPAACGLGVAVAVEGDPQRLELAPQAVRVRQRAVVHQAPVLAGGVGVRVLGRDRRLGGHAGVRDQVRAREAREAVLVRDLLRRADVLVQVDRTARREHVERGEGRAQAGAQHGRIRVRGHDAVVRADHERRVLAQAVPQCVPVEAVGRLHAQLALAGGQRLGEHGDARRVRAALGHADQHRLGPFAEPVAQRGVPDHQSDDAAHRDGAPWFRRIRPQKNSTYRSRSHSET